MCDPITIATIAATAAAAGLNKMASNKVAKERDGFMQLEQQRQDKLDREASALNTASQNRYEGFEGKREERETSLGDYFTDAGAAPQAAAVLPPSSSNIVNMEQSKRLAEAKDFTDQQGRALADVRSFGDYLGSTSRDQARDAGALSQVHGFKKGSTEALGYELEGANHAGDDLKMMADIASGVSAIAGGVGAAGGISSMFGAGAGAPLNILPKAAKIPKLAAGAMVQPRVSGLSALY